MKGPKEEFKEPWIKTLTNHTKTDGKSEKQMHNNGKAAVTSSLDMMKITRPLLRNDIAKYIDHVDMQMQEGRQPK